MRKPSMMPFSSIIVDMHNLADSTSNVTKKALRIVVEKKVAPVNCDFGKKADLNFIMGFIDLFG